MKLHAGYFLDTNIFLRTIVKDDVKTSQICLRLIKIIKDNQIKAYTNDLVLAEIVWTLGSYYHVTKSRVGEIIASIVNLNGLTIISGFDYLRAVKLYQTKNVKFIDACIASIPQVESKKWPVVTYDNDFKKLPVKRLLAEKLVDNIDISN